MDISSRDGDIATLHLPARFDFLTSMEYRVPKIKLMADASIREIRVDCSRLDYIDSMGIGVFIAWQQSCAEEGKKIAFRSCSPKLVKIFRQCGVAELLKLEQS